MGVSASPSVKGLTSVLNMVVVLDVGKPTVKQVLYMVTIGVQNTAVVRDVWKTVVEQLLISQLIDV
jgi:hypothetical protein